MHNLFKGYGTNFTERFHGIKKRCNEFAISDTCRRNFSEPAQPFTPRAVWWIRRKQVDKRKYEHSKSIESEQLALGAFASMLIFFLGDRLFQSYTPCLEADLPSIPPTNDVGF